MWFTDPATGQTRSASASARSSSPSTSCCSAATRSAATRSATWSAAAATQLSRHAGCGQGCYDVRAALNRRHMLWAWVSLFSVALRRTSTSGSARWASGPTGGSSDADADDTSTTCSSSAPAAPGCARPSRPSAAGVKVGLICKSLLGKAHTVMAEGGIAAALGNVDDRDSWKVHFADTMRGGQYVNNWRMAELHAKEAPDRVRELEAWGARLRSHEGRPHPAAQLRRPPLSAPGARRRSHRPRDDPHAAGPRHPPRHRRAHGVHRRRAARATAAASPARSATTASAAASRCSAPRRSSWPPAASAAPTSITSNSWEDTGDGHALAYHAGAELHRHGVRPVPSDRDGLAAERAGHPRHRGRARRRRRPAQQRRPPLHVRRHPGQLQEPDRRQRGRRLALHAGRQERAPSARAAHARSRRALHHARGQGRPRQPARRRVPRHRLDQGEAAERRRAHQARSCRACTTSSSSWPTSTSPRSRWKSARRRTT